MHKQNLTQKPANYWLGDATKAREKLGWEPKVTFTELVHIMVDSDLELARKELLVAESGISAHEQTRVPTHE